MLYGESLYYKTVKDFNQQQCVEITLMYSNTPFHFAASYIAYEFSRDGVYAIKPETIRKVIKKTIRNAWISEEVALRIREKATYNAAQYGGQSCASRTWDFYSQLIKERKEFIENGYKRPKKKKVAPPSETPEEFTSRILKELETLENSQIQIIFKIDNFDELNEEGYTLDELIRLKDELEKKIRNYKYYNGLK